MQQDTPYFQPVQLGLVISPQSTAENLLHLQSWSLLTVLLVLGTGLCCGQVLRILQAACFRIGALVIRAMLATLQPAALSQSSACSADSIHCYVG